MVANVLIIEDNERLLDQTLRALQRVLDAKIHGVTTAETALRMAKKLRPHAMILDLRLSEESSVDDGISLLMDLLALDRTTRITVLTGYGSADIGARCLQAGATNFLEKPPNMNALTVFMEEGIKQAAMLRAAEAKRDNGADRIESFMVAEAPSMRPVVKDILRAATTNTPVLLLGETGTGKGVAAKAIHYLSSRARKPFVRYQPCSTSLDLLTSDLFGHVKGAFTGADRDKRGAIAQAHTGTFFLDEVDELHPKAQVALLGVLQDHRYRPVGSDMELESSFRLISASNRPLEELLEGSKLREDLYHRIARVVIMLPPLRERLEDIPLLLQRILQNVSDSAKIQVYEAAPDAIDLLQGHGFRGNIRELEALVEQAAFRASEDSRRVIHAADISTPGAKVLRPPQLALATPPGPVIVEPLFETLEKVKRDLIRQSYSRNNGNYTAVARELQIDRRTVVSVINDSKTKNTSPVELSEHRKSKR